jgi:hypothetical protein
MIHLNKGGFMVRDAHLDDLDHIELRQLDAEEVWASHHMTPKEALQTSFKNSMHAFTVLHKDKIVAMFGVIPDSLLGRSALVWMLTTDAIDGVKIAFLRYSRLFINYLRSCYPILYNHVDARHAPCLRWLKWVGAAIHPAVPCGADQLPFHPIVLGGQ